VFKSEAEDLVLYRIIMVHRKLWRASSSCSQNLLDYLNLLSYYQIKVDFY